MSVTLTMRAANGEPEQHELPGPGGKIRLVVGDRDGPHAGVWSIWATPNKSDVYIALRAIAGYQKWSLHQSGDWLYQWVKSERAMKRAMELNDTEGRVLDQWQEPAELAGSGWTSAFSIRVRHQDLVQYDDDALLPEDMIWVPAPPEGLGRQIHLAIVRPSDAVFELEAMLPWCGFTLADGRYVLIILSTHPVPDETNARIEGWLAYALQHAPEGVVQAAKAPRMAVGAIMQDGGRVVWDLAIPSDA